MDRGVQHAGRYKWLNKIMQLSLWPHRHLSLCISKVSQLTFNHRRLKSQQWAGGFPDTYPHFSPLFWEHFQQGSRQSVCRQEWHFCCSFHPHPSSAAAHWMIRSDVVGKSTQSQQRVHGYPSPEQLQPIRMSQMTFWAFTISNGACSLIRRGISCDQMRQITFIITLQSDSSHCAVQHRTRWGSNWKFVKTTRGGKLHGPVTAIIHICDTNSWFPYYP